MNRMTFTLIMLFLSGCSVMTPTQQLTSDIIMSQGTVRYILKGNVEVRKQRVVETVDRISIFVEGNPEAPLATLVEIVDKSIDWSKVSIADRLLINSLVKVAVENLKLAEKKERIPKDLHYNVKHMLDVVKSSALLL